MLSAVDPGALQRAILERLQDDPVGYRHHVLGVNSTRQQDEVSQSVVDHQKTLVQAAHGVGKTHLVAGLVQWYFDCFQPSIGLTTAPNWTSVVDLLWAEVNSQRRTAIGVSTDDLAGHWNGIATMLRRTEMHYAKGHNARTGEGFQGRHDERLFIAIDEGPGVPVHIWKAVDSMLQSELTRLIVIGNPTVTSGPYYDARSDPSFHVIRMSALDHPNIRAELNGQKPPLPKAVRLAWILNMIEKHCIKMQTHDASCFEFPPQSGVWYRPNDEFRSRVLGLFPQRAANSVWDEAILEYCRANVQTLPEAMPEIGVDVARFGDDLSVVTSRVGSCVLSLQTYAQVDTVALGRFCIMRAGELGREFKVDPKRVPIKIDDIGIGGGVTDYVRSEQFRAIPVNAAHQAFDVEQYPNRRSELWFSVSERANDRQLDLSRLESDAYIQLKKDLLAPTYAIDGRGRRVVESKDITKRKIGRSPDSADSLNLAYAPDIDENPLLLPTVLVGTSTWGVG